MAEPTPLGKPTTNSPRCVLWLAPPRQGAAHPQPCCQDSAPADRRWTARAGSLRRTPDPRNANDSRVPDTRWATTSKGILGRPRGTVLGWAHRGRKALAESVARSPPPPARPGPRHGRGGPGWPAAVGGRVGRLRRRSRRRPPGRRPAADPAGHDRRRRRQLPGGRCDLARTGCGPRTARPTRDGIAGMTAATLASDHATSAIQTRSLP